MAKVEMDLAELKQLEKQIEDLKAEKQDLIDRQHQVVIYHKYFNGKIRPSSNHGSNYIKVIGVEQSSKWDLSSYRRDIYPHPIEIGFPTLSYSSEPFSRELSITDALNRGYIEVDLTEDSSRHSKDYVNMSEVITEIRSEERQKLLDQLEEWKNRVREIELKLETLEEDHNKQLLKANKAYKSSEEELINTFESKLKTQHDKAETRFLNLLREKDELTKKYNDLLENKKTISLEEEIKQLKEQLRVKNSRGFFGRVLNL